MGVLEHMTVVQGGITTLQVDAIVNAANASLLGGGGVDAAIHRAAGPELVNECRGVGGCPPGQAKTTDGYSLRASWVIHTVGPVWQGGHQDEEKLLASCYRESLNRASQVGAQSIAFPAISTGVYRFPKPRAAAIAIESTAEWLEAHHWKIQGTFCCFSTEDAELYEATLAQVTLALE